MKYIVFTNDNGLVYVCTPETEKETLAHFILNDDKTAPDGFSRKEINGLYVIVVPKMCEAQILDDNNID